MLTGLGVFRLYFSFDWTAGDNSAGQLFNLRIRGGQSFNLFEAESFGSVFWISLVGLIIMSLVLPLFRIPGGTVIALACVAGLWFLHYRSGLSQSGIPIEFELLMVFVLYLIYLLLQYIGEVRDRKRVHRLLNQYVPAELADEYQRDPDALSLTGEEREVSVLFCDVIGFSAITEQLAPAQLAEWLNLFFTHVSRIVVRNRGSIDKYMGDSVMALWGAPVRSQTHAYDALCTAMSIQTELHELNDKYAERHLPSVSLGIGISTGPALVGPLGSEHRMDYTVIGDTVNVAQRLEAQTRKYAVPVIVGDGTTDELPDMAFRELDTVMVKGRLQPVTMYEPLGSLSDLSESGLQRLAAHDQAMKASRAGDWDTAVRLFTELRDDWGPASMYELYLRGIEQARKL